MEKSGRKPLYDEWITEHGLLRIEGWARDGLNEKQICMKMGIGESTLTAWKKQFPEIRGAIKKGREPVDVKVENALLKSALGYDYEEKEIIENKKGEKTVKTHIRHMPANITAQIFWLKNRKPEQWREKPVNVTTEEVEDDGLIAALGCISEDIINADDDSAMHEGGES